MAQGSNVVFKISGCVVGLNSNGRESVFVASFQHNFPISAMALKENLHKDVNMQRRSVQLRLQ